MLPLRQVTLSRPPTSTVAGAARVSLRCPPTSTVADSHFLARPSTRLFRHAMAHAYSAFSLLAARRSRRRLSLSSSIHSSPVRVMASPSSSSLSSGQLGPASTRWSSSPLTSERVLPPAASTAAHQQATSHTTSPPSGMSATYAAARSDTSTTEAEGSRMEFALALSTGSSDADCPAPVIRVDCRRGRPGL